MQQRDVGFGSNAALTAPKSYFRFNPGKQPQLEHSAMSQKCHDRTQATQQMASSFNHLVSPEDQCRWDVNTKCIGCFQVNREHELRSLLDRNVGWRNAI